MSLTPIAQAVVTDPGGGSAGYALVASSPGLAPEDAELLERSPGVSEYLHTKENPRPCFSFFQLPSGAWALNRRFVSGKRRGDFNRIIGHTLVLSEDVLRALAEEPSLLTSHCTYRPFGQGSRDVLEFFQLGKIAAHPEIRELADLSCQPPTDLQQALVDLASQRRKFLLRSFDAGQLEALLTTVFGALANNRSLLFPQQPAHEELLRLAWSSLPPADRRQVPWTTHFAPGVRIAFRMQNAPNPERAGKQQAHPEQWWQCDQTIESPDESAAALAVAVARDQPSTALRLGDLSRWPDQLKLFGGRGALRRWLSWVTHWSRQIEEGCASLEELRQLYAQVSLASKLDPWIQASSVLRCTCHSIRTLRPPSGDHQQTVDVVFAALERYGLAEAVLDIATLETLSRGVFGELEASALALALRAQPSPPRAGAQRESLFETLVAGLDLELGPLTNAVLLDLTLELVCCHSPVGRRNLAFLARESPPSIALAPARLAALSEPLPVAAVFIEVLREVDGQWQEVLRHLLDELLLTQLTGRSELNAFFDARLLIYALQAASPAGLARALGAWRGEPYDVAVDQLRTLIAEQPELARETVALVATEQPHLTLESSERLAGVSLSLSKLRVPAAHWTPLAIAEANWFDRGDGARELADKVFMPLLSLVLTDDEAASCYSTILQALSRNAPIAGHCHMVLFRIAVAACPRYRSETLTTFEELFDSAPRGMKAGATLFAWAPAIRDARARLDDEGHDQQASHLVALWWRALARVTGIPPQELLPTLDWVRPTHRPSVVAAWLHRIQDLAHQPLGKALTQHLQALTRGDRDLARRFRRAQLRGEMHPEDDDLIVKINELHEHVAGDPIALHELLDARVLPSDEPRRSLAVLRLLTSPESLWQTVYEVLETDFLIPAVEEILEGRSHWLMDTERLTAREQVLVRVAKKLGQMAHKNLDRSVEFLTWALDAQWPTEPIESATTASTARDLFVATLLASSEIARDKSWDLIDGLVETRQTNLLERLLPLAEASRQPYLRRSVKSLADQVTNLRGVGVR